MKSQFRRQKPSSLRERGRSNVRWTVWEITALVLSIVMMASPLLAAGFAVVFPNLADAQRSTSTPTITPGGPTLTSTTVVPTNTYPVPSVPPTTDPCPTLVPTIPYVPPTDTPTNTPTATTPISATDTPTNTPTATTPISATDTPTNTPTATTPISATDTPTNTPTATTPISATNTPTNTPTNTTVISPPGGLRSAGLYRPLLQSYPSPTVCVPTSTPTDTPTNTATNTPTDIPTSVTVTVPTSVTVTTAVPTTPTDVTTQPANEPISLSKVSSKSQVAPNDEFVFAISVSMRDTGDGATSRDFSLNDVLPAQLTFVSVQWIGTASCTGGATVICSGTVTLNNPVLINVRVKVNASVTPGTVITNTATATVTGFSPVNASDSVFVPNVLPTSTTGAVATTAVPSVSATTAVATTAVATNATQPPVITNTSVTGPTNTSVTGPTNTRVPGATQAPTKTNVPGATQRPTNEPTSTPRPGDTRTNTPVPAQTVAPVPPTNTPRSGLPVPSATQRPGQPAPTTRPGSTAAPGATSAPGATAAPNQPAPATNTPTNPAGIVTTPLPVATGLQFQKKSDWGSRFAGESLMYTITVISPTGTLSNGNLRDVIVVDQLPSNLEVNGPIKVSDQNARVEQQGNQITVRVALLPAGQTLTIMIPVKIKDNVAAQTRIVNQAQLRFNGSTDPVYSNIASVLVVGNLPPLTATAIAKGDIGGLATANPATVTQGQTGIGGVGTARPSDTGGDIGNQIPSGSTGIPLAGFVLFGLTLLIHNVRVRREMTRI